MCSGWSSRKVRTVSAGILMALPLVRVSAPAPAAAPLATPMAAPLPPPAIAPTTEKLGRALVFAHALLSRFFDGLRGHVVADSIHHYRVHIQHHFVAVFCQ